jgi:Predicted membrane protein (DUF2207)
MTLAIVAFNPAVVLLPVVTGAIVYAARRASRAGLGSIVPQFVPPSNLTTAESGMLLHDRIGPREIAATIVDLVLRKYVRMVDRASEAPNDDVVFQRLKPEAEWSALAAHERTLIASLFSGHAEWATVEQLRQRVPDVVLAIEQEIEFSLREKNIYRHDPNASSGNVRAMLYVASIFVPLWTCLLLGVTGPVALVMSLLSTAIAFWGIRTTTFWTDERKQAYVHLQGLREFINAVDADRLQRLQRYQFDALLPYAMMFGIEHKWTQALRDLGVERLDWVGDEQTDSVLRGSRLTTLGAYLDGFAKEEKS